MARDNLAQTVALTDYSSLLELDFHGTISRKSVKRVFSLTFDPSGRFLACQVCFNSTTLTTSKLPTRILKHLNFLRLWIMFWKSMFYSLKLSDNLVCGRNKRRPEGKIDSASSLRCLNSCPCKFSICCFS